MPKKYQNRKFITMPLATVIGTMISVLITIVGTVACTQLMNLSTVSEKGIVVLCPVIWFISSFVGCIVAARGIGKRVVLTIAISAVLYFAVLFSVSAIFLDGNYGAIGWGILSIALGAVLSIILNLRKNCRSKPKFKYR